MKQYAKYLPFQKVRVILKVNVVITLQGLKIISNILKPKKGGGRVLALTGHGGRSPKMTNG